MRNPMSDIGDDSLGGGMKVAVNYWYLIFFY